MDGNDLHDLKGNERYEELLARWLSGDLTEAELQELEAFEGKDALEELQQVVEASSELTPPAFDQEASWERLAASTGIEMPETSSEVEPPTELRTSPGPGPELHTSSEPTPTAEPRISSNWPRYAIGLAIAAGLALIFVFFILPGEGAELKEYYADAGKALQVNLPDGSVVELNKGSRLSLDEENYASNREVMLTGEAFFKVAKGERFRVSSEGGYVDVLGTRFNVQARADKLLVGCYSGRVRVSDKEEKEIAVISEGEYVSLDKGQVQLNKVAGEVPGWAKKDLEFDGADLAEVLDILEIEFDVEIKCSSCKGYSFSGILSNSDLKASLDLVTLPFARSWTSTGARSYEIK